MADARNFTVYDASGAPNASATPSTATYRDRSGNVRSIDVTYTNLTGGEFSALPSDADEAVGCVLVVDTGVGNEPRYIPFAIHKSDNSNQFWVVLLTDEAGALWTGAAPTVGVYRDKSASARSAPALIAAAGAYLWSAAPTAADVLADVSIRVDAPAGAIPKYYDDGSKSVSVPVPPTGISPGLSPAQRAVNALRRHLLANVKAKTAQINNLRVAELTSSDAGPFAVEEGMVLRLGINDSSLTDIVFPDDDVLTAAEVVTLITAASVPGITATVDGFGCICLQANLGARESGDLVSSIVVGNDGDAGTNRIFGWSPGGERVLNQPLYTPGTQGICDGYTGADPANGLAFTVIIADREVVPFPSPEQHLRRDLFSVRITLEIYMANMVGDHFRSTEAITSACRVIREILSAIEGLQLGRANAGDIQRVDILKESISSKPFSFTRQGAPSFLSDFASMTLDVRMYQRPDYPLPIN